MSNDSPSCSAASPNFETFFDLTTKAERLRTLEASQSEVGFWSNPDSARTTVQEIKTLKGWVTPWEELHGRITGALEMAQLLETEPDVALQEEMARETDALDSAVEAFQLQAMLQGPDDDKNAILAIHPGAGGTESQDWAEMLLRMYLRWAERTATRSSCSTARTARRRASRAPPSPSRGAYAYGYLKSEHGVHRLVRISPYDFQARRHTSFASVDVYPEVDDTIEIEINDKDCGSTSSAPRAPAASTSTRPSRRCA